MAPESELDGVAAAFRHWWLAEMACHYAAPCDNDVADHLGAMESQALAALAAAPVHDAEDILLKMFPLLLANLEAPLHAHPLVPSLEYSGNGEPALLAALIDDLRRLSPLIAEAMASPNPYDRREAA